MQCTTQLVNLTILNWLIEHTQSMKHSSMLYTLGVYLHGASDDIDLTTEQLYIILRRNISPLVLW